MQWKSSYFRNMISIIAFFILPKNLYFSFQVACLVYSTGVPNNRGFRSTRIPGGTFRSSRSEKRGDEHFQNNFHSSIQRGSNEFGTSSTTIHSILRRNHPYSYYDTPMQDCKSWSTRTFLPGGIFPIGFLKIIFHIHFNEQTRQLLRGLKQWISIILINGQKATQLPTSNFHKYMSWSR